MKKLLLLSVLLLVGCSSVTSEDVVDDKPVLSEKEYIKQQDKYEFDMCVSLTGGIVSRCENIEAVCYITSGYDESMSISCFKKDG